MAERLSYKNKMGVIVPSVTTIIGRFKDSGPLLYWANKIGREEGKTLQEGQRPAATAGTMAHNLVEAHLKGQELPILEGEPDIIGKARRAFDTYLNWQHQTKLEMKYTEVPLVSEQFQFGGRLDAIGTAFDLDGQEHLVLVDWKTSNSVYSDYLYQLAAYRLLWEENYPDHPITGGFHLCRFAKEEGDFAHHYFPALENETKGFLVMRELYDIVKKVEKRVR